MEEIIIYQHETPDEMANKIFFKFEVGQSCKILGMEERDGEKPLPKGLMVCNLLKALDEKHNCTRDITGKIRRKRKVIPDSIGGYVGHKIFRTNYVVLDDDIKYTIWRIQ